MTKYYICNDIKFLDGAGGGNISPSTGKHYKMQKAASFVKNNPRYRYYKERTTPKGNDYVISTKMKFIGDNNNVVDDIKKAKSFSSSDEAYAFLDINRNMIDPDISYVIDAKFCRKERSTTMQLIKPKETNIFSDTSSKRIKIPLYVKKHIFDKSNGICCICGKPLSKYCYTIDHIIPLSKGGTNMADNLRAVHENCNKLKGNFTDEEMANLTKDIFCNDVYNRPLSNISIAVVRSIIRGVINQYNTTNST